jgi:hypothetical protein
MKRGRKPTIEFDEHMDLQIVNVVIGNKLNLSKGFQQIADEFGVAKNVISARYYNHIRHKSEFFNLEEGYANVKVEKSCKETRKTYTVNGKWYHEGVVILLDKGTSMGKRLPEGKYRIMPVKAIPKKKS